MNYLILEANEELRSLTRSTVQNCLNTLVNSYPRYLLYCSNYFNEIYFVCLLFLDVLFMSRSYKSTISEFFYSLERRTSSRIREKIAIPASVFLNITFEYLESLDRKWISSPIGLVNRIYRIFNALSLTDYPSLTDHLLEVKVAPTENVRKNTFALAVLVLFIKISQFYYARSKRKITVPPPKNQKPKASVIKDICPVCAKPFANPVASLDGFVYCFSCTPDKSKTVIKIMD